MASKHSVKISLTLSNLDKRYPDTGYSGYIAKFEENNMMDNLMDSLSEEVVPTRVEKLFERLVPSMGHQMQIHLEFGRVTQAMKEEEEKETNLVVKATEQRPVTPPSQPSPPPTPVPPTPTPPQPPILSNAGNIVLEDGFKTDEDEIEIIYEINEEHYSSWDPNPMDLTIKSPAPPDSPKLEDMPVANQVFEIPVPVESEAWGIATCSDGNRSEAPSSASASCSGSNPHMPGLVVAVTSVYSCPPVPPPANLYGGHKHCKDLETSEPTYVTWSTQPQTTGFQIGEFRLRLCQLTPPSHPLPQFADGNELETLFPNLKHFLIFANPPSHYGVILLKVSSPATQHHPWRRARTKSCRKWRSVARFKHMYYPVQLLDIQPHFFAYGGLGSKTTFELRFLGRDIQGNEIRIGVNLLQSSIVGAHELEDERPGLTSKLLPHVFDHFFNVEGVLRREEEEIVREKEDLDFFYRGIKEYHSGITLPNPDFPLQHPHLRPTLRDYQKESVRWMLFREGVVHQLGQAHQDPITTLMQNLYKPITLKSPNEDKLAFYNHFLGFVTWRQPPKPFVPTGGILANEMGLGKTVEMLALILANRKYVTPSNCSSYNHGLQAHLRTTKRNRKRAGPTNRKVPKGEFTVPGADSDSESFKTDTDSDHEDFSEEEPPASGGASNSRGRKHGLVEVKATLVVTPPTIVLQWRDEILKHVKKDGLKFRMYRGVKADGELSGQELGTYDVVLTTYQYLSGDLGFESPLESVRWWRVILDEAQMVEGLTSRMAAMATRLTADHRWCVTGTPISKGLKDLLGLFTFLRVKPICVKPFWNLMVDKPFRNKDMTRLSELLGQFLWRHAKADVKDELGIPEQREVLHWLQLSPAESRAYYLTFEKHKERFAEVLRKLELNSPQSMDMPLSKLNRRSQQTLLSPLLELRKSCCYPEEGVSNCFPEEGMKLLPSQKGHLNIEQAFELNIKRNLDDFMEAHHFSLSHLNEVGDFKLARGDGKGAAAAFGGVLNLTAMANGVHAIPSLQTLHAAIRLKEMGGLEPAPLLKNFEEKMTGLKREFKARHKGQVHLAQGRARMISVKVDPYFAALSDTSRDSWWDSVLTYSSHHNIPLPLTTKLLKSIQRTVSESKFPNAKRMLSSCSELDGVREVIRDSFLQLKSKRNLLIQSIRKFELANEEQILKEAEICHLRYLCPRQCDCLRCVKIRNCKKCERIRSRTKLCPTCHKTQIPSNCTWLRQCQLCSSLQELFLQYDQLLLEGKWGISFLVDTKGKSRAWRQAALEQQIERPETFQYNAGLLLANFRARGKSPLELILKRLLDFAKDNDFPSSVLTQGAALMQFFPKLNEEFIRLWEVGQMIFDFTSSLYELKYAGLPASAVGRAYAGTEKSLEARTGNKGHTMGGPSSGEEGSAGDGRERGSGSKDGAGTGSGVGEEVSGQELKSLHTHSRDKARSEKYLNQYHQWKSLKEDEEYQGRVWNCEICSTPSVQQMCFLPCAHSFCFDVCLKNICPIKKTKEFECPTCRNLNGFSNITFVNAMSMSIAPAEDGAKVLGEHSTKVEAIVRTLLSPVHSNPKPGEKVVLFSEWDHILRRISYALDANGIKNCLLVGSMKETTFQNKIQRFKESEEIRVLLMLLGAGCKGLNIIQATHVFLVEPTLKYGSELQAIGRVHRIGQTRPTFVHRFLFEDTVEDAVYQALHNRRVSDDSVLVRDLHVILDPASAQGEINTH